MKDKMKKKSKMLNMYKMVLNLICLKLLLVKDTLNSRQVNNRMLRNTLTIC